MPVKEVNLMITIGIDVGNYDTKSQHSLTPSSYRVYETKNLMADEYVFYNGLFYVPTRARNNQQRDKTEADYCLNISLFAIAKEILYLLKTENPTASPAEIQKKIDAIAEFQIGVGLPAGHFNSLAKKTKTCYEVWKNGLSFEYVKGKESYCFSMTLKKCDVFVQDLVSVFYNSSLSIPKDYSDFYIIGIGGGTADIIPIVGGRPEVDQIVTLEKGSTVMYMDVARGYQQETGDTLDYNLIEGTLLGKPNVLDEKTIGLIHNLADNFVINLIEEVEHHGLQLRKYPSVFIGGGALIMQDAIKASNHFVKSEFVQSVYANAQYYARLAEKNN